MNSQRAADELCVTCLAVPPYMESGVSEYRRALPRRREREGDRERGSEGRGGKENEEREGEKTRGKGKQEGQ